MHGRENISVAGDYASGGGATIDKSTTINLTFNITVTQELLRSDGSFIENLVNKIRGLVSNGDNTRVETIPVLHVQGGQFRERLD